MNQKIKIKNDKLMKFHLILKKNLKITLFNKKYKIVEKIIRRLIKRIKQGRLIENDIKKQKKKKYKKKI